jgi:uncharacterized membrane protein
MTGEAVAAILGMAVVTYLTRIGGLWLMGRVTRASGGVLPPRVEAAMRAIPGAILVAIVAPAVLASGPAQLLAAGVTAVVAARTRSLVLALVVGVAAVWALRIMLR